MAKQRKLAAGTDLLRDLEAAAGTPDAKRRIREIGKMFGGNDFTRRFTQGQKEEILALAAKFVKNQRKLRELMRNVAGGEPAREPRAIREGEAERMAEAERGRIKKVLDAAVLKPGDLLAHALFGAHDFHNFNGRGSVDYSFSLGLHDSTAAGRKIMEAREARVSAIPYEKRGVCYEEMGLHNLAAEAFRDAAVQVETKDKARGSRLHERAGDLFCKCREEGCGPLLSPSWSGTSSPGFHAPLPEPEEPTMGRTMYEEAIREYLLAANLVRKTDPDRAKMLESRIGVAQSKLHDEEDGISRDE